MHRILVVPIDGGALSNITDEMVFKVQNWSVNDPFYTDKRVVRDVSFYAKKGEIVGLFGLQGAGRTELAMSLFGKSYESEITGDMYINGKKCDPKDPKDALRGGLDKITHFRIVDTEKENAVTREYMHMMHTKAASISEKVEHLSGGNQQKVMLSKWMFTDADVIIIDEPTRGIDVGAKYEIYTILGELAQSGKRLRSGCWRTASGSFQPGYVNHRTG